MEIKYKVAFAWRYPSIETMAEDERTTLTITVPDIKQPILFKTTVVGLRNS